MFESSPLVFLFVWPVTVLSFALTLLCSTVCMVLANVNWNDHSMARMTKATIQ